MGMRDLMDLINEASEPTENDDGSITLHMPKREEECPAVDFLKAVWEATSPHPFMNGVRMWGAVGIVIGRDIDDPNTTVHLKNIESYDLGKGEASELLKGLCAMADDMKVIITITAKAYGNRDGNLKTKQLVAWYSRAGFVRDGFGNPHEGFPMKRKPA